MNVRSPLFVFSLMLVFIAVSCAPGNEQFAEEPAGFFMGFWHGLISVITLIISIFDCSVRIYEINNSGWWYDFGFILGAGFAFGNIWFTKDKAKKK